MGAANSFLPEPVTSASLHRAGNAFLRVGVAEVSGFRVAMEDAHCAEVAAAGALFGVFDGHAGDTCSGWLAERFPLAVKKASPQFTPLPHQTVVDLCLTLDSDFICERYVPPGGSTAAFLLVSCTSAPDEEFRGRLQAGHVGDSRVLVGRAGRCLAATVDHKPDTEAERARILAAGGTVEVGRVDGKLALSRAFGDPDWKDDHARPALEQKVTACPDVQELDVLPGDYAILSCDGLFEPGVTSDEVLALAGERLEQGEDCALIAAALCKLALDRGSQDNVTVMVIHFGVDGRDFAAERGAHAFAPGPFRVYDDAAFFDAYNFAARHARLSVAAAYEMRYDLVRKELAGEPTLLRYLAGQLSEESLSNELAKYGPGPPLDATGATRTEWFLSHLRMMCREQR